MSEAWGVSGDEHAQDFARRVDEFLESRQFETGLGSLEDLPDVVQEVYGRARTPKVPWQTELGDFIRAEHERRLDEVHRERVKLLLRYPYLGAVMLSYDPSRKTEAEIEAMNAAWGLSKPITNRFIQIGEAEEH